MNVLDKHIKEFAKVCNISSKKEKLINARKRLFELEREMAKLTLDYEGGTYVHMLDEYESLKIERDKLSSFETGKLNVITIPLGMKLKKMESNPQIGKYLNLKREYLELLSSLGDYYETINVKFRKLFSEYNVPNIYVFQGYVDNSKKLASARNIILPDMNLLYREEKETIIYPVYEISSNRDLRHFYNKVSFKYLEAMAEDYSFDLDSKNLGKIRVKNNR